MGKKKNGGTVAIDIDSILNSTVVDVAESKAKETKPVIVLSKEESEDLKTFISKKTAKKTAETDMATALVKPLATCCKKMEDDALSGQFHSSYKVTTLDGTASVNLITVDKFTVTQDPENIKAFKELVGEEFDNCIVKDRTTQIKQSVLIDKVLLTELVTLVGPQNFSKFFETVDTYSAKDGLKEHIYKVAGNSTRLEQIKAFVIPQKPYFK